MGFILPERAQLFYRETWPAVQILEIDSLGCKHCVLNRCLLLYLNHVLEPNLLRLCLSPDCLLLKNRKVCHTNLVNIHQNALVIISEYNYCRIIKY